MRYRIRRVLYSASWSDRIDRIRDLAERVLALLHVVILSKLPDTVSSVTTARSTINKSTKRTMLRVLKNILYCEDTHLTIQNTTGRQNFQISKNKYSDSDFGSNTTRTIESNLNHQSTELAEFTQLNQMIGIINEHDPLKMFLAMHVCR